MKLCQWGHGAPHGCRRREPEHPRERFEVLEALGSGALRAPEVTASPLGHVDLPAVRGPESESPHRTRPRPCWRRSLPATAQCGQRRSRPVSVFGELQALRVGDVDLDNLDAGLISVERSWDVKAGVVEPKSRSGRRRVPIADERPSPPG